MWYEERITRTIAEQLFAELEDFTQQYVINRMPRIRNLWPFPNDVYEGDYKPNGAIVHLSRTTTISNAFFMLSRGIYNTHFVIASNKHHSISHDRYPLVADLPAYVFMPVHPNNFAQHSGWISKRTIGIDLRNVGQLRPHEKGIEAVPLYSIDENKKFLSYDDKLTGTPDLYTYHDCWKAPFQESSYAYRNYYYENISVRQLTTLIIILRCLYKYIGLDTSMIVPSNCINGETSISPNIVWDNIRQMIDDNVIKYKHTKYAWINSLYTKRDNKTEMADSYHDEATIGSLLDKSRWRGECDFGQLSQLNSEIMFDNSEKYKHYLGFLGYEYRKLGACNRAMKLYAASKGLGYDIPPVVCSAFESQHVMENDE